MVVAAIRNSAEPWSLDVAAEDVPLDSPEVSALIERMALRAERAGHDQDRDYLEERVTAFLHQWRTLQLRPNARLGYIKTRRALLEYAPLMQHAGDGRWNDTTVARSMRETENDINLLLPPSPRIFDFHESPAWRAAASTEGCGDQEGES
jgi:hypothetical protein